jgi:thiol-disulfide isomerase/thioredoxin
MTSSRKRSLILTLASIFVIALSQTACPTGENPAAKGERPMAPEFDLPLLDGTSVRLSELRGKIVILDFWATWCAPCEVQMPELDRLWRDRAGRGKDGQPHAEDDLMIVGLSVDTKPVAEIADWIEERGLEYPIALANHDLAMQFGVFGFPTLLIVDKDGRIHTRHTGVLGRPEIEAILEEIRSSSPIGS